MRRLTLLLLLLVVGCGTVVDRVDEGADDAGLGIYGGVRRDLHAIAHNPFILPLVLLDLPLSAIADTLALPWSWDEGFRDDSGSHGHPH